MREMMILLMGEMVISSLVMREMMILLMGEMVISSLVMREMMTLLIVKEEGLGVV
jgi:hypothetical protein